MRDDRRQPHLEALDVAATGPQPPGAIPATTLPRCVLAAGVVDDERPVAEVDGHA